MQNLSQFGPVVHSGEGLGMKKGHSIFYYESTCTFIFVTVITLSSLSILSLCRTLTLSSDGRYLLVFSGGAF